MYKLGIDVGGTNTDAVLIDENLRVIAEVKHPTSGNVFEGIIGAVQALLGQTQIDRSEIRQAMLGTTQCTNAIVERKNLAKIGLLRIGAPATVGVPPMVTATPDSRGKPAWMTPRSVVVPPTSMTMALSKWLR